MNNRYNSTKSRRLEWSGQDSLPNAFVLAQSLIAHQHRAILSTKSGFPSLDSSTSRNLPNPPELLLNDDGRSASLPPSATLLITPVILLDQHGSTAALLELFLFIVTSEFALDKDGSLCHLFIKCILQGRQEEAEQ